jgi:hypothetical protein
MTAEQREVIERLVREERERICSSPPQPATQPSTIRTIHYTDLAEMAAGSRIGIEWNFYRKQVGRLLAEGQEGRWLLIKGEEIIGIWDTKKEAEQAWVERFLMQDVLIHQILEREPMLRGPMYFRLCPS